MTPNERPRDIEHVPEALATTPERRRPSRPKQVSEHLITLLRQPAAIPIPGPPLGDLNLPFMGDGLALAGGPGADSVRGVPMLAIIGWVIWAVLTAPVLTVTVWLFWAMLQ